MNKKSRLAAVLLANAIIAAFVFSLASPSSVLADGINENHLEFKQAWANTYRSTPIPGGWEYIWVFVRQDSYESWSGGERIFYDEDFYTNVYVNAYALCMDATICGSMGYLWRIEIPAGPAAPGTIIEVSPDGWVQRLTIPEHSLDLTWSMQGDPIPQEKYEEKREWGAVKLEYERKMYEGSASVEGTIGLTLYAGGGYLRAQEDTTGHTLPPSLPPLP